MKNFIKELWYWHGLVGKILTILCVAGFLFTVIGLPLGLTRCQKIDELSFSNTFLNEEVILHDNNYALTVKKTYSLDSIEILDKAGNNKSLEGHYVCVELSVCQNEDSKLNPHVIDADDFKLKDHTGVHVPLSDIASMVGWNMIDYRWDQAKNGFVVSSANFSTRNSITDYSYIGKVIKPGQKIELSLYFSMDSKYNVESEIMVLEVDFYISWNTSKIRMGEDIILLPRPENLPKDGSLNQ